MYLITYTSIAVIIIIIIIVIIIIVIIIIIIIFIIIIITPGKQRTATWCVSQCTGARCADEPLISTKYGGTHVQFYFYINYVNYCNYVWLTDWSFKI
jgi:hypothetical protein